MKKMSCLFLLLVCFSCSKNMQEKVKDDATKARLNFFNESSFKVDIYRNINPSNLDKSTRPIVTVPAGSFVKVKVPASKDKRAGDVFYIRYYVQFADSFDSGVGKAIYVQAERGFSNISFVLNEGMSYTKAIVQPEKDELKFVNGYIKVQNTGDATLQVVNGDAFLNRLGTEELDLESGKFAFYEFAIPSTENSVKLTNLNFFVTSSGNTLDVTPFVLERGKVYNFQCNAREMVSLNTENIIAY